ncbi:hypothetical protein N7462_003094 [Penicillium macrosclerotiorum]|uniref:uncharacterized protein n=1 Tax=Penicillium macrosclerotiorum TaxID=303699 RepID=UPI0025499DF0|nr:uncharacterized protein N7462_003094 [Penicillium macrosclerotiorum]KAJ5688702.1 hypothetical protein N7462_003094 [Penicillium macrosclerotiorum]
MSTIPIYVAILPGEGAFNHWGLFIDGTTDQDKALLQVKGSDGQFKYEPETRDARQSEGLIELFYLCHVGVIKVEEIKAAADQATIYNDIPGWNCQDYVIDLLEELQEKAIMGNQNQDFEKQMVLLRGKQEGLA